MLCSPRTLEVAEHRNEIVCVQELPLKLARNCVNVFGESSFREGERNHQIDFGCEEEIASLHVGKDMAFVISNEGKLFFSGKNITYEVRTLELMRNSFIGR